MKRSFWVLLLLGMALVAQGCIIPRAVGGVLKGAGKAVEGAVDVVTAPF